MADTNFRQGRRDEMPWAAAPWHPKFLAVLPGMRCSGDRCVGRLQLWIRPPARPTIRALACHRRSANSSLRIWGLVWLAVAGLVCV